MIRQPESRSANASVVASFLKRLGSDSTRSRMTRDFERSVGLLGVHQKPTRRSARPPLPPFLLATSRRSLLLRFWEYARSSNREPGVRVLPRSGRSDSARSEWGAPHVIRSKASPYATRDAGIETATMKPSLHDCGWLGSPDRDCLHALS